MSEIKKIVMEKEVKNVWRTYYETLKKALEVKKNS